MIEQFFGTKFLRTKYVSFDSLITVCYEEQSGEEKPFRIVMNQQGLWFEGKLKKIISSMDELQDWAKLMSKAWADHEKLAPKITKTLSGH